jgi:polysaccharide biosynthesis/export protein
MRYLTLFLAALFLLTVQPGRAQSEIALRPGDKIILTVGGVPSEEATQINNSYTVAENGSVTLLHLGAIKASGLTASQLSAKIMQQYRDREIYTNPNITINTDVGAESRVVYVDGYVTKPGPVPFRPGLTAANALASAGGKTPFGKLSKCRLTRTLENGQVEAYQLNLTKPGSQDSMMLMLPNDTLSIPN